MISLLGACALSLICGGFIGCFLERWSWEMSADSHHHSHKSNGRWFGVFPKGWQPFHSCPVCGQKVAMTYSTPMTAEICKGMTGTP